MSKSSTKSDPIDALRGRPANTDQSAPAGDVVFIDYRGKIGPDHLFDHVGELILTFDDRDPVILCPGLNLLAAAEWESIKDTAEIESRRLDDRIVIADANLARYSTASSFRDLADRTQHPKALEHLLEHERAKPFSGRMGERQDPEIVAKLERKARAAAQRGTLNMAGVVAVAKQRTEVITKKAS